MKIVCFWNVKCGLVEMNRRFGRTSVPFYQTIQRQISVESSLHIYNSFTCSPIKPITVAARSEV
jgi:hypothetical protein